MGEEDDGTGSPLDEILGIFTATIKTLRTRQRFPPLAPPHIA